MKYLDGHPQRIESSRSASGEAAIRKSCCHVKAIFPFGRNDDQGLYRLQHGRHSFGNYCWSTKMYLHNTPHCICAYLGAIAGYPYIHMAITNQLIYEVVFTAMGEMKAALKKSTNLSVGHVERYAEREMARFKSPIYDPISRVARDPTRKLAADERLLGAIDFCLKNETEPRFVTIGTLAAIYYLSPAYLADFTGLWQHLGLNDPNKTKDWEVQFLKYRDNECNKYFLQIRDKYQIE